MRTEHRFCLGTVLPALFAIGCGEPAGPESQLLFRAAEAPSNTSAIPVSATRIDVYWQDNSSNETGFELYRSTTGASGAFALLVTTGAGVTGHADNGLTPSTQYCYKVRAVRTTGRKATTSAFSATVCATTLAPPPPVGPTPPSGLDARPVHSTSVKVSWIDNSTDEAGFRVERSFDLGTTWSFVGIGSGPNLTSYTDNGRASEQPVCYRVIAHNAQGSSAPSNVDCTAPPAGPSGLVATVVDFQTIDLSWTDNSAVEDGYEVRRAAEGEAWGPAADLPPNSASYRDVVPTDTKYSYVIRAKKDGGYSTASNTVRVVVVTTAPAAPAGTNAAPLGSHDIRIWWADQSANEEGFRVERSLDGGASWQLAGTTGSSQYWFYDGGRASDQPACYRVSAFNSVGDSPASNTDCTTPPAAPTGLLATTAPGLAIDLAWSDNSNAEDGYEVQRLFTECYYGCYSYYGTIATLGPNATSYHDAGLTPGESHSYVVMALKDGGRSDLSNEAAAWSNLPPAAPSNLTATVVSSGQIDLAWTDNSSDEEFFGIERCLGDAVVCDDASFVLIWWANANATTFSDTGLSAGVTYTYRVRAYLGGLLSGPSNEATATTPGQEE